MISIVAAVSNNNIIGFNNKIPWRFLSDQLMFKKLTLNHTIIMGRKTFESIKNKLKDRKIIVLTKQKNYKYKNILIAYFKNQALKLAGTDEEIFIAGGQQIFKMFMDIADKIYLTKIYQDFVGDTYFPKIDSDKWKIKSQSEIIQDPESKLNYSIIIYTKK